MSEEKVKKPNPPNAYKIGESWYIEFRWKNRTYRKSLGTGSRTFAAERAAATKKGVRDGKIAIDGFRWNADEDRWVKDEREDETEVSDPLFAEAIDAWLEWAKTNHAPTTFQTDKNNAKPLLDFFGEYRLSEISPFLISKYRTSRKHVCECANLTKPKGRLCPLCKKHVKQLSDAKLNHEIIILKSLFKNLKSLFKNVTETNPTTSEKLAKLSNGRTRCLTRDEAQRLLSACNPDFRDVVLLALNSGCRSCEIKTLKWENVDIEHRVLTIEASVHKNREVKKIPLNATLIKMFRRIKEERNRQPEDLVFLNRYGKPWKDWRTAFQNACQRAGIKNFTFHDLRHVFASWLAMNGTAQAGLMALLGHKDSKMTQRYTHISDQYKQQAVQSLPTFDLEEKSFELSFEGKNGTVLTFAK